MTCNRASNKTLWKIFTKLNGVFSRKRRTVATSSDCNFRGVVTMNAEAGPTSAIARENERATDVQRRRSESIAAGRNELLVLLWSSPWE